ncbi:MAG: NADH-quinone oxidoreductase subunit J [Hyphomicrobiaceae bacterium]|nr:NADH-quinone oxidoreductase subunit J [Hyphomicrobiaceae bacterium]
MTLTAFFFYLFAILAVISATLVITAKNPVHGVLYLIVTFFNAAGLFVLLGAEFLAMLLVVVYVGAVAVLFLFVVMMLDVDFAELRAGFIKNAPVGLMVGGVVLVELIAMFAVYGFDLGQAKQLAAAMPAPGAGISNTKALGLLLYTKYVYFFQGAGLVLLVAMIGAIVLTLRHKEGVRRQSISAQVNRNPKTAMEVVKVAPGQAIVPSAEAQR